MKEVLKQIPTVRDILNAIVITNPKFVHVKKQVATEENEVGRLVFSKQQTCLVLVVRS